MLVLLTLRLFDGLGTSAAVRLKASVDDEVAFRDMEAKRVLLTLRLLPLMLRDMEAARVLLVVLRLLPLAFSDMLGVGRVTVPLVVGVSLRDGAPAHTCSTLGQLRAVYVEGASVSSSGLPLNDTCRPQNGTGACQSAAKLQRSSTATATLGRGEDGTIVRQGTPRDAHVGL